jgi:hypothetical protein
MCISQGSNLRTVDIRRKLRHTSPLISLQKSWKLFRGLLLQASSSMEIPRRMKRPIALSRQCSSTTTKDIRDLNITGPQTQRPHRQHTNWHIATLKQRQSTVENERVKSDQTTKTGRTAPRPGSGLARAEIKPARFSLFLSFLHPSKFYTCESSCSPSITLIPFTDCYSRMMKA